MDKVKNMCFHLVPLYVGDRPANTRGKPNESSNYYFRCYMSAGKDDPFYREARDIYSLCNACKKYYHIKPLNAEEIRERYFRGEKREVLIVSRNGCKWKTL